MLQKSKSISRKSPKRERTRARDGKQNVIGAKVRAIRLKLTPKASLEDIAGRLASQGVLLSRSSINKIELRQRTVNDVEIIALARALRVKVAELFE
ncbi:hypothetical protein SAMN05444156_0622 [Verrucomicrobium sp. GAS474]|uniref:hypothetical protein n=1 Tax=Verrucomicrobium sp. GAS474 TaxID=1882831 RepID=UPI00087D37C3|nr:hypothetical protein [Verrucomicrobium sp. GAS474]SDT90674.1 hypothetical protein SAMN05444156_0622 [Verrucomicrobium sp. GAS474]